MKHKATLVILCFSTLLSMTLFGAKKMSKPAIKKPQLVLYYRPTCPFCTRVISFLESNKVEITLKDISKDEKSRLELIKIGGKQQVPCLFIDGSPTYESADIIHWIDRNIVSNS